MKESAPDVPPNEPYTPRPGDALVEPLFRALAASDTTEAGAGEPATSAREPAREPGTLQRWWQALRRRCGGS